MSWTNEQRQKRAEAALSTWKSLPADGDLSTKRSKIEAARELAVVLQQYVTDDVAQATPLEDLPADATTGKLIVQLAGRTLHWEVGPGVLATLLQNLISGLGPAKEGA